MVVIMTYCDSCAASVVHWVTDKRAVNKTIMFTGRTRRGRNHADGRAAYVNGVVFTLQDESGLSSKLMVTMDDAVAIAVMLGRGHGSAQVGYSGEYTASISDNQYVGTRIIGITDENSEHIEHMIYVPMSIVPVMMRRLTERSTVDADQLRIIGIEHPSTR